MDEAFWPTDAFSFFANGNHLRPDPYEEKSGAWILGSLHLCKPCPSFFFLFLIWDKFRDEAHARLGQLRDKAEKDLKQYISEMKELERFLENDRRMSEFVNTKLQERTFTEEALRAKAKKRVYLLCTVYL